MAGARRGSRQRGKSDLIDAIAVARAAIAEGIDTLPSAHPDGRELDLRLLVDHRDRLVRARVALNNTRQWHLHDLWPELEIPGGGLFSARWQTRIVRRLGRAEQTTRVRIARDELRHLRELTATSTTSSRQITRTARTRLNHHFGSRRCVPFGVHPAVSGEHVAAQLV